MSKVKRAAAKERKRDGVFLYRRKVKSKVIPTSFLKIQERETFVGAKDRRERNS